MKGEYSMRKSFDFPEDEEGARQLWRRRTLHRAVERELTERQREIFTLYYEDGLSFTAIAARLQVAPSTVSRTYARGLRRLRRIMDCCE